MTDPSALQSPPFLILHKGKRTGGTAATRALAEVPGLHVLMDPLHQSIHEPFDVLSGRTSDHWVSHHPEGYRYFESYRPLLVNGEIPGVPVDVFADYVMEEDATADELASYLRGLVESVRTLDCVPVLAFETSEGRIPWLRDLFPEAIQAAVVREPVSQLQSWFQQAAHGNYDFFSLARSLIRRYPAWFDMAADSTDQPVETLSSAQLEAIFTQYRNRVTRAVNDGVDLVIEHSDLVRNPDVVADKILSPFVVPESRRAMADYLRSHSYHRIDKTPSLRAAIDTNADLRRHNAGLHEENAALRAQTQSLAHHVEQLRQEHELLRVESDQLRHELDTMRDEAASLRQLQTAVLSSKSWRYTAWLRRGRRQIASTGF